MRKSCVPGILILFALCASPHGADACRFWGLVGARYPADLVTDHLRDGTVSNLEILGGSNPDGWGLGYFHSPAVGHSTFQPVVRRGGPRANHPNAPGYRLAVDELSAVRLRAAIGHVRAASSGHTGVPDPHPFQREGILFAHNGTIPESTLLDLILLKDPDYLESHPPEWTQGYIDSELYLIYLLKYAHDHPKLSRTEAYRRAIRDLSEVTTARLNFVMTEGDTLWAVRCAPGDTYDAVQYSPSRFGKASSYWAVASQPLGSDASAWSPIPSRTLAMFVPGTPPVFLPIDAGNAPLPGAPSRATIGNARPNPGRGEFAIPIRSPIEEREVSLEVWDLQGRCVWRSDRVSIEHGESSLRWDGRDMGGREVGSGVYFCRVRTGSEVREERIHVIR